MKTRRLALVALVAVLALLLAGCFDVKQEITFNGNNTGHFMFDMGMSQELLQQAQSSGSGTLDSPFKADEMKANPFVKNVATREYDDGDMHHYVVDADFTDMLGFFTQEASKDNGGLLLSLTRQPNGNYLFSETLNMSNAASSAGTPTDSSSLALMKSAFAGKYWTVRVKAPNIVSHNGTLDTKTGFVEWKIPMADLMSNTAQTQVMKLEFRAGPDYTRYLPYAIGALCCCLLLVVIIVVVVIVVMRRKKTQAAPASPVTYPPA